jgi:hypothetical protein
VSYKDVKFLTRDDAVMRLDGGVTLYKDIPVRIVLDENKLCLFNLLTQDPKPIKIDYNDDDLVTRALPTGYCDIIWSYRWTNPDSGLREYKETKTIAFFARASHRKQKSVIHPSNMSINLPEDLGGYLDGGYQKLYTKPFGESLINKFNSNRDFTSLRVNEGQAISRNFAVLQVEGKQKLLFNEACIGERTDYGLGFGLIPDYNNSLMIARLAQVDIPVN